MQPSRLFLARAFFVSSLTHLASVWWHAVCSAATETKLWRATSLHCSICSRSQDCVWRPSQSWHIPPSRKYILPRRAGPCLWSTGTASMTLVLASASLPLSLHNCDIWTKRAITWDGWWSQNRPMISSVFLPKRFSMSSKSHWYPIKCYGNLTMTSNCSVG